MPGRTVHRLSVERNPLRVRRLAPSRHRTPVAVAIVERVIDVSVEAIGPVVPRTRADKYSAVEPLRSVVSVGSAIIRRSLVVAVRTNRRTCTDSSDDADVCRTATGQEKSCCKDT